MRKKRHSEKEETDGQLYARLFFAFIDLYKNIDRVVTAAFIAKQAGEAYEAITGREFRPDCGEASGAAPLHKGGRPEF